MRLPIGKHNKSIIRKFLILSVLFGISMGIIFPFYARIFISEFKSPEMAMIFNFGCIMAGIMVGAMSYLIFKITILNILRNLSTQFKNIADGDGDLKTHIDLISHDELGHLTGNFNKFVTKLAAVVREVLGAAEQLSRSSEEISKTTNSLSNNVQNQAAMAEELSATIEEVSTSVDKIAENSVHQYEKLDSLSATMHELTNTIQKTSQNVENTMTLTHNTSEKAKAGSNSLSRMNSTMKKIMESSQQMTNIIGIINDISDKINLLSLNAAIEAARAGDYGKGFAVVADEISKLADQTAGSTAEIDKLIKLNNQEIQMSQASTAETIEMIGTIIEDVNSITSMMNSIEGLIKNEQGINEKVDKAAEEAKSISEITKYSTEEQRIAFSDIVQTILNLTEVNQTNASVSEELAASSKNLSDMAKSLDEKMHYFQV